MRYTNLILVPLLAALPSFAAAAVEQLPSAPSAVEVPQAGDPQEDAINLISDQEEFLSALKFYSDIAFVSPAGSPQYLEASAAGQYLRSRVEDLGLRISRATGGAYRSGRRGRGGVSFRVASELDGVFGFLGAVQSREGRSVSIKDGYCRINYVKNNVPFLVQSDSFLNKGEVIITFDDGPGQFTEEVSADMKAGGAPSVFFVLGSKLGPTGKARAAKAAADGHEVAVHGYWHATEAGKPLTALSTGEIVSQLSGVKDAISAAAGRAPRLFRPPYGIITPEALRALDSRLGLVPVGWTIDTLDWSTKDPEELFQRTISLIRQRGKGIVLMHDIHDQSRQAAKRLVAWLEDNGYKVVSPDTLVRAYRGE